MTVVDSELESTASSGASSVVPRALRVVGACLLVAAASSFMFRDYWGNDDEVLRYLLLLGQLVLLAGAGFFCALAVKEKRGARTFLSLVVAVVPVHFAVLGGVVYSQFALDTPPSDLPAYAVWRAPDPTTAVLLVLGALVVIVPATFVAMLTLVRRHAGVSTIALLASNALLLVPVRDPDTIACLVAVAVPALLYLQTRVFTGTASHATPQGRLVRAMLIVPLLLLVGRTLIHYSATVPFVAVAVLASGLALFVYVARVGRDRRSALHAVLQAFAVLVMFAGSTALALDVVFRARIDLLAFVVPMIFLPWALVSWLCSAGALRGELWYRRFAGIVAVACVSLDACVFLELRTALLCLAIGLVVIFAGARVRQKLLLVLGGIGASVGLACVALVTLRLENLVHWGSLTLLGVALIFAASFLDRARQRVLGRFADLRVLLREWRY